MEPPTPPNGSKSSSRRDRGSRRTRRALAVLFATAAALVLTQITLLLWGLITARPVAERQHTRYDPELGWVSLPLLSLPDIYGPGIGLHTDERGFRSPLGARRAAGAVGLRFVCSGDSFTLGYGVADEDTWCEQIARRLPGSEPVNMGQGGYGMDQSFLWYRREAPTLQASVHLFALVLLDIHRMASDQLAGYGKPVLRARNGALVLANVPVPRRAFWVPWWTDALRTARRLPAARLLGGARPSERMVSPEEAPELAATLRAVLAALAELDRRHRRSLVLVFLPRLGDHAGAAADPWRELLAAEASRLDVHFVDLVPDLRRLTQAQAMELFLAEERLPYAGAAGHYSALGHAWVADHLARTLQLSPPDSTRR